MVHFRCPRCAAAIASDFSGARFDCVCGQTVARSNGVVSFVEKDAFYEGKFTVVRNRKPSLLKRALIRLSINESENRTWREGFARVREALGSKPLTILNIGAGGGEGGLKELGYVVSVDLSLESLYGAKEVSDLCVQADATKLPFSDAQFDLVFSSHFLGHLPLAIKQEAVEELYRVTKPGGFSLHSAETDADNFVFRKAKQFPELYQKNFVDMYGHYGLELPEETFARFRKVGFVPLFERPDYCVGVVRPSNSYKIFFGDPEYRKQSWVFRVLHRLSALFSRGQLQHVTNVLLRPFTFVNRFFGPNSTDSVKLLYRKRLEA